MVYCIFVEAITTWQPSTMYQDDDLSPEDEARRQHLVRLLTLAGMSMVPITSLQAFWGDTPDKLPDGKSIFSLDGEVQVNGRSANLDTQIRAGDTVSTGGNSEVIFAVGSDSFIMRSNSEMQIEGGGFLINTLRLLTGSLLGVFGQRTGSGNLGINTNIATIGIRGTGVYLESEPDRTYLCTCYGVVGVAANSDPNDSELITATHHDAPKYITAQRTGQSHIQPAPFKNHTDAELKILEAIVGREVPFGIESELYKGGRRDY